MASGFAAAFFEKGIVSNMKSIGWFAWFVVPIALFCAGRLWTGTQHGGSDRNGFEEGKPTDKGSISFIPVNGQGPTEGAEIIGGKYKSKASLGECKVEIRVPKIVGKKKLYDTPDSPSVQDVMEEALPAKYNTTKVPSFGSIVKKGKNEKNWELKLH